MTYRLSNRRSWVRTRARISKFIYEIYVRNLIFYLLLLTFGEGNLTMCVTLNPHCETFIMREGLCLAEGCTQAESWWDKSKLVKSYSIEKKSKTYCYCSDLSRWVTFVVIGFVMKCYLNGYYIPVDPSTWPFAIQLWVIQEPSLHMKAIKW